jgi:hypothetical protein
LFRELGICHEESVVDLEAYYTERLGAEEEARIVGGLLHLQFVSVVRMVSLKPMVASFRNTIERLHNLENCSLLEIEVSDEFSWRVNKEVLI